MKALKYFFKEWVVPFLVAIVIVAFITKYIFILVTVPTGSMEKTIMPGDRLFISKTVALKDFRRADIIVFKSDELNEILVKRLIGLPGDNIKINQNGEVFVNDEKITEDYAAKNIQKAQEFNVPEDKYFFLGDNRPRSFDSRFWKDPFISKEKIVGKAIFRFFPFDRVGRIV